MKMDGDLKVFDARLHHPSAMLVCGPSQSGKSTFTYNLLCKLSYLYDHEISYIVWFHGNPTPLHEVLKETFGPKIQIVQNLPESFDEYICKNENGMFIFDDLMVETSNSKIMTNMFCRQSHHENISIILLTQNLFSEGRERRNFLRNCHYLVLFKNPLDLSIPYTIAQKVMPKRTKLFINIFEKATNKPNGYLFIDGHQNSNPAAKFRTNLFDDTQHTFLIE